MTHPVVSKKLAGTAEVEALPGGHAPPSAPRIPRPIAVHDETLDDDYFWLREKTSPDVAAYLEAENAYADAVMAPTAALQERLYREMLGRIKETDLSVPYREGGYFYYSRTEEGKQYPIYCRRKDGPDAREEVTLDLNELAAGHSFLSIGAYAVSDDGALLAYSIDTTGFREYTLYVKDLRTGERRPERIEKTGAVAWAGDGQTLFYAVEDQAKRPHRVYRHHLGPAAPDELVYEETDELFRVWVGRTRSKAYLLLGSASHTTTEVRYRPAGAPVGEWRLVAPRRHEHEYDVDHHGDRFYIRTNDRGRNFRLVWAPADDPRPERWQEVVAHRPEVMLEGAEFFRDHSVLLERERGLQVLRVTDLRTGAWHRVEFPEPAYAAFPSQNPEFETNLFRYSYQSLVTPSSVFDHDMEARTSTLLKEQPVLGGYDRTRYVSERLEATAPDGTRVPISIVYRKGAPRDGTAPLHLHGYGSYGYPLPVGFSSNRLSLLDRGMAVAIAHVRGGGEMGKAWHDDGRMLKKRNTFTDFIAAAEHLVAERYTSSDRLAIEGGSAGGLLVGAVVNMRPELIRLAISKVPFVDVLNTMLDESLPLTVGEYEEWGNPNRREEYDCIRAYCPYTNLAPRAYPTMLVKTSFNDSQVMYWEPAKYVARLRTLKTDGNLLLLKTNMAAGHGGASGRYDYLREVAFDYAFVLTQLGLER
ncbi:MAG TPA: S9 family peptidase [Vicinamibacteria bacterium]|nr:S9 family peptidase [Vicinamibacteria bacterium]